MRKGQGLGLWLLAVAALATTTGCAGALVEPGHRGLYFDPSNGGIQHEVLQPGWYRTACPFWVPGNKCPRVEDFDVTYSTAKEELHTISAEGLSLDVHTALKYRPIVSELYLLDTEIGANYFDEVVGPELRSAMIGVMARTPYSDLQKKNGAIEDEIEKELRERLRGKHVEISSVLIEHVDYAPEILQSQKERVVSQEQTLAQKQVLENTALQKKRSLELTAETRKLELNQQTEQKRLELQAEAEQKKLAAQTELELDQIDIAKEATEEKARIESSLRNKKAERQLAIEQAQIDHMKAEATAGTTVTSARGEAGARLALAKATAAENAASAANVTPMQVMMHAYDALGKLGGTGSTFLFGDYSKLPGWLFPKMNGFEKAPFMVLPGQGAMQASSAPAATAKPSAYAQGSPPAPKGDENPY